MLGIAMTYCHLSIFFQLPIMFLKLNFVIICFVQWEKFISLHFFYDNKIVKCTNTVTKTWNNSMQLSFW